MTGADRRERALGPLPCFGPAGKPGKHALHVRGSRDSSVKDGGEDSAGTLLAL